MRAEHKELDRRDFSKPGAQATAAAAAAGLSSTAAHRGGLESILLDAMEGTA